MVFPGRRLRKALSTRQLLLRSHWLIRRTQIHIESVYHLSHRSSYAISSAVFRLLSCSRSVTIETAAATTTGCSSWSVAAAASVAVQEVVEGTSEVRIEDVVDDGGEHGPAAGQPL